MEVILIINTALLSVVTTLAGVIWWDMQKRIDRMDEQNERRDQKIMACLSTMIAIVNHIEHLPEHILTDLHKALTSN